MDETILLVEDDPTFLEMTARGLEREGFRVTPSADGREGLHRFLRAPTFDAVVLDIMLPLLDGVTLCREIRRRSAVPIMLLTARGETSDVVQGLEAGADEYVRKPVELPELAARIRAMLRRARAATREEPIAIGDLSIDPAALRVRKRGRQVPLTATEIRLLVELVRRPGQVLTREVLLDRVWEIDFSGGSRMVDMAVKRLREKVEDDPRRPTLILTVRGLGYVVEAP